MIMYGVIEPVCCVGGSASVSSYSSCYFLALSGSSFSFTTGSLGSASAWLGPLLNSSLSAGHSKLCFGCNSCRDLGALVLPGLLGVCVYVYVKFSQRHIALIYYLL